MHKGMMGERGNSSGCRVTKSDNGKHMHITFHKDQTKLHAWTTNVLKNNMLIDKNLNI